MEKDETGRTATKLTDWSQVRDLPSPELTPFLHRYLPRNDCFSRNTIPRPRQTMQDGYQAVLRPSRGKKHRPPGNRGVFLVRFKNSNKKEAENACLILIY